MIRCSPRTAVRAGMSFGAEAAQTGRHPVRTLHARLGRVFWRLQPRRIRDALVLGFVTGYQAAIGFREAGAPVTHRTEE